MTEQLRCPVDDCSRDRREADMLMCPQHWYSVPKPARRAVWRAWEGYQAGRVTLGELRAVQGDAIDAANAAENARHTTT